MNLPYVTVRIPDPNASHPRSVIAPTRHVMDETAAAWVRQHVLSAVDDEAIDLIRTCPCQYGPCGHCLVGRHLQCAHRTPGYRVLSPLTYLLSRRRHVLAPVWPADGQPCAWRCPCPDPDCAIPADAGREITTHIANVTSTLPKRRPARRARHTPAPADATAEALQLW